MKTIHLNSFKIFTKLPLNKIAAFFKMLRPLSWKEYIVLKGQHLEMILKHSIEGKQVYLFEFGCITFVNLDSDEIRIFLEYIESIIGKLDYMSFAKFYERHLLYMENDEACRLWKEDDRIFLYQESILPIVANILAKSTALSKIEGEVNVLLDDAENFIKKLQIGQLYLNSKEFQEINTKILRFQYDIINTIRILDRTSSGNSNRLSMEISDALSTYYELQDRVDIIQSKIDDLQRVMKSYSTLSFKQNENRLYWFEIFLLVLFPLSHILHYTIPSPQLVQMFNGLFK